MVLDLGSFQSPFSVSDKLDPADVLYIIIGFSSEVVNHDLIINGEGSEEAYYWTNKEVWGQIFLMVLNTNVIPLGIYKKLLKRTNVTREFFLH